ncbi:DUF2892 domain-containing protein [Sulfoacidibacillus thermotolerans]|uniref:DUF2892 domain-containing protein n=1 Tax=Sulfoacidibacillus thermotolerans TaxID=1765684 RepID=A0A2U3DAQ2_SULT2|nr:DUF2892 domain-containing protein [Sulfoacidibacillus thermotolerans]PWI58360.1 hypothetical protein BM613_03845 [Sulfoacidibacillus thermotolerans]
MSKNYVCEGKGSLIRLLAGSIFWISILLSLFVNKWLVLIGGLPATMLIISYTTGFCPTELVLKKLGVEERIRVSKAEMTRVTYKK